MLNTELDFTYYTNLELYDILKSSIISDIAHFYYPLLSDTNYKYFKVTEFIIVDETYDVCQYHIYAKEIIVNTDIENNRKLCTSNWMNLKSLEIVNNNNALDNDNLKFINPIKLDFHEPRYISSFSDILDISHMVNLKILRTFYNDKVQIDQLKDMDLIGLEINDSRRPPLFIGRQETNYDIKHLKNLKYLNLNGNNFRYPKLNRIFDIKFNNLVKLILNCDISNINHMINLRELHIYTRVNDEYIKNLNLTVLFTSYNVDYSHMTELKVLQLGDFCDGIQNSYLTKLNLIKLFMPDNLGITDLNHMTKLKILEIHDIYTDYNESINTTDKSIEKLNLCVLRANKYIKNLNKMKNLKILEAGSNMSDEDIKGINPCILYTSNIPNIKTINHMTKLKKLEANFNSGISEESIKGLNIIDISADKNPNISVLLNY